jgi:hypothetical protein
LLLPEGKSMKLTQAAIRRLLVDPGIQPDKDERFYWGDKLPGFVARFRRGAEPTFIYQFRFSGKQRRLTVGLVDALDVTDARSEAVKLHPAGEGRRPGRSQGRQSAARTNLWGSRPEVSPRSIR